MTKNIENWGGKISIDLFALNFEKAKSYPYYLYLAAEPAKISR